MKKLYSAIVALALIAVTALPAVSQLDPGFRVYEILQADIKVGEIYVPKGQKKNLYVEHWVLFPAYRNPSEANAVRSRIVQSEATAKRVGDFFGRTFPAGSRYVEVTAHESDKLPCNGSTVS